MREVKIPKGGGRYRTIYVPSRRQRKRLRDLLPAFQRAYCLSAQATGTQRVAHGFVCGRNSVTCAREHKGYALTVSCDLSSWFDSVRPEQIAAGLELAGYEPGIAAAHAKSVCHLGAPRQGLPTSPSAANLAAVLMDRDILDGLRILDGLGVSWVYTRYADDLTVSLSDDSHKYAELAISVLTSCAEKMGWTIAVHKTSIQRSSAGRRVIVGVSVGTELRATKRARRKLRSAQHHALQDAKKGMADPVVLGSARGLSEWCAMRLPRAARPDRQVISSAEDVSAPVLMDVGRRISL